MVESAGKPGITGIDSRSLIMLPQVAPTFAMSGLCA